MPNAEPIMVAGFYRFVDLPDFRELRDTIRALASSLDLRGTVLLAPEGINSTIAGNAEAIESFFQRLAEDPRFASMDRRVTLTEQPPFGRLKVRLKKEIVRLKSPNANPTEGVGRYVEPAEWNALIKTPGVLVVDVRNTYETELGTFEGAVDPKTRHFSEFATFVEEHLKDPDQPIATFCTGGIRCEKATAYLKSRGFRNVMHLKGGILNYLDQIPEQESLWRGTCFVFDNRGALDHDLESTNLAEPSLYAAWPRRTADNTRFAPE